MITFKPIIIQGGRRKDGTWPVKVRVTYKGVCRRLPTTLVCTDADLTRSGKIKNNTILEKAGELIARMRSACTDLSPFTLEEWEVDQVVDHIKKVMLGQSFRLDFFTFADEYLDCKKGRTRNVYATALNSLERFLGRRSLDVNDITRQMLIDFTEFVEAEPWMHRRQDGEVMQTGRRKKAGSASAILLGKLSHIFAAAKYRYNDEDAGRILIPRSPFDGLRKSPPPGKGSPALEPEVLQRVIDARGIDGKEDIALAAFVVSLGTQGANLADLYAAREFDGDVWVYNRQKTAPKRPDNAEVRVCIPRELSPFISRLKGQYWGDWWLPALHRWGKENTAVQRVNIYLRGWCEREGLPPFTFGSARHSWGTLARRIGVEKATVDEALAHIGDYRVTDIYAERNWSLSWEANRQVLALFRWPSTTGEDGLGQTRR